MATTSASELIGSVCKVLGRVVTPAARAAFTPSSCAEALLKGTEIGIPRTDVDPADRLRTAQKQN